MKILITGINGFVGQHLSRELKKRGCLISGLGRDDNLNPSISSEVENYYQCDLMDEQQVSNLPLANFDAVVSLAGLAKVGDSFGSAEKYYSVNTGVVTNICDQIHKAGLKTKVIAVSSGAVYDPNQHLPLTENSALINNGSPYAQSKILMEKAIKKYQDLGVNCIIVRPFNHFGPGQEKGFLLPDLYAKLMQSKATDKIMRVGDLTTRRDYTDVRDVVRAYADLAIAEHTKNDIYNVCSGTSYSGQEILDILLKQTGLSGLVKVEMDEQLTRPDDARELYGNYDRLKNEFGWEPEIELEKTISDYIQSFS